MQGILLIATLLVGHPAQNLKNFPEKKIELSYHGHNEPAKVTICRNHVVIEQGMWTGDGILHPCGRLDLVWMTESGGAIYLARYQLTDDGCFCGSYHSIAINKSDPWAVTQSRYIPLPR